MHDHRVRLPYQYTLEHRSAPPSGNRSWSGAYADMDRALTQIVVSIVERSPRTNVHDARYPGSPSSTVCFPLPRNILCSFSIWLHGSAECVYSEASGACGCSCCRASRANRLPHRAVSDLRKAHGLASQLGRLSVFVDKGHSTHLFIRKRSSLNHSDKAHDSSPQPAIAEWEH